jgi:hypothetical protein
LFVWPLKRQIFALCRPNCAKFELLRKFPTSLRCSHAPGDQFSCVRGLIWLRKSSGIAILFFFEKLCRTATALASFFCLSVHALDKRKKKQTIPPHFASSVSLPEITKIRLRAFAAKRHSCLFICSGKDWILLCQFFIILALVFEVSGFKITDCILRSMFSSC